MRRGVVMTGCAPSSLGLSAGYIRTLKACVNEHYSMDSRRHEYRIS